jgi:hypothetical protein
MKSRIDDILERIAVLERELERELREAQARWRYRLEAGKVHFEREVRAAHARLRKSVPRFLGESSLLNVLTGPLIYGLVIPIALLDVSVTVYQHVCFRAYGIARVRRSAYIVIDRHHLAYLNAIEKVNCVYCGYANGVFAYVREVAGRTEQYWCPIRHAKRVRAPHLHYREFVDYGDAEGYRTRLMPLREELREEPPAGTRLTE